MSSFQVPRKYQDCSSAEQKIVWLNSPHGQAMLNKRPRLQELYRTGKLQHMVNHPEWASKLDMWLNEGGWRSNIAQFGRDITSRMFGTQPTDDMRYTFPPEPFSNEVKMNLLIHGYAVLKNFINPEQSLEMPLNSPALSPVILPLWDSILYNNTPLAGSIALLLHNTCVNRGSTLSANFEIIPQQACQIALRFPENTPPPSHSHLGGLQWHTDGMDKGDYAPFTLLVGVALTDQPAPLHGNLCVFEGSHYTLQDAFRSIAQSTPPYDMSYARRDLGEPTQLQLQVGDVVLLHQKLAHRGGPHFGHEIRKMVYFRIRHRRHEELKLAATEDLWLEFEGMQDVV